MPDYRLPERTSDRHSDQQPCAVQREISDPDCDHYDVLHRNVKRGRYFTAIRPFTDFIYHAWGRYDIFRVVASLENNLKRSAVLLYTGTSAIPQTTVREGHRQVYFRQNPVRTGACGNGGSSSRSIHLGRRKYFCR